MLTIDDFGCHGDRVRGFFYGYNYKEPIGPFKDFRGNKEFTEGWREGALLRLEELRADLFAEMRQ